MTDNQMIISRLESNLKSLKFQKQRIFEFKEKNFLKYRVSPVHDADFYMIILRRLYRMFEKIAKSNSQIANIKGKYKYLYKKIKLRDHFEHDIDLSKFPDAQPGFKIITSVQITKNDPKIISGDQEWHLNRDHDNFVELINNVLKILIQPS